MGKHDLRSVAPTTPPPANSATPTAPASEAVAARKPHRFVRTAGTVALTVVLLFLGVFLIFLLALPFTSQVQYQSAKGISTALKWTGAKSWVADFEDGNNPNGCSVIARQGDDQMQVTIDPQGNITKVAYTLRVDNTSSPDAASVNLALASMEDLLASSTSDIWTAITRVEITDKVLSRGLAKGKSAGEFIDTGQGQIHVAYSFANFKDYQLIRVAVDAPKQVTIQ